MTPIPSESLYWSLHGRACEAMLAARLEEAARLLSEACEAARQGGLPALADRAYCTLMAMAVEQGASAGAVAGLSRILGHSPDLRARCLAAQSLASAYRTMGKSRIAGLYAEVAIRLADEDHNPSGRVASLHLLALLRLGQGLYREARELFDRALEIALAEKPDAPILVLESARAYGLALAGETAAAKRAVGAIEGRRSGSAPFYRSSVELNLGFTCLELGEPEAAEQHARDAAAVIPPGGEDWKYARFLHGEAAAQRGDFSLAREQFRLLQQDYYPEFSALPDFLLSLRTQSFVNWLA